MRPRVAALLALPFLFPAPAISEDPGKTPGIQDNSFLIEEAYNQDRGVIQEIQTFAHARGIGWVYTLTQEWPVPDQKNQLSFTLPVLRVGENGESATGPGDLALNYRYQLVGDSDAAVAMAPRFTLLLPTGSFSRSLGAGTVGFQGLVPVSAVLSPSVVTHWNLGATWYPRANNIAGSSGSTVSYLFGQSFVWLTLPTFNLMLETLYTSTQFVGDSGDRERRQDLIVSPGVRFAINVKGGLQIVTGVAVPLGVGPSQGQRSVLFYLSFEHPIPGSSPPASSQGGN